jgi:hypothetical protein
VYLCGCPGAKGRSSAAQGVDQKGLMRTNQMAKAPPPNQTGKAPPPNQTAKEPPLNQMATAQPSPGTREQTLEPKEDQDILAHQALEYFSNWPKTYGSTGWMPCPVKRPGMTEWEKFKAAQEKVRF